VKERGHSNLYVYWHRTRNISKRGISAVKTSERGIFLARVIPRLGSALGIFLVRKPKSKIRTVSRVVLVSSQPLVCCRVLFIIFILTASALRSCETPPTTFPTSFDFFAGRGIGFHRTRLPGCGCLRGIRIRSEFKKIRDLESRAQYLFCTDSRLRAAAEKVRGRLPPE
jgi:hypothetical protein